MPYTKTQAKKELQRIVTMLDSTPCSHSYCEGSHKNKLEFMMTCTKCWAVADLRELKKNL